MLGSEVNYNHDRIITIHYLCSTSVVLLREPDSRFREKSKTVAMSFRATLTHTCTGRKKENKHTITSWVYLFQHWRCSQLFHMGITSVSFVPALSKDHSGPQIHLMSLVLLASHCRKQKGGWTVGYCFVFVYWHPLTVSLSLTGRDPSPLNLPERGTE